MYQLSPWVYVPAITGMYRLAAPNSKSQEKVYFFFFWFFFVSLVSLSRFHSLFWLKGQTCSVLKSLESGAGGFFIIFLLDYQFWRSQAAAAEDFDLSTGRATKIFRIALTSQPVGWQLRNFSQNMHQPVHGSAKNLAQELGAISYREVTRNYNFSCTSFPYQSGIPQRI